MANKELINKILTERLSRPSKFVLEDYLFKEQLDFVNDPARFALAVTSVRSGKSVSCAADLINTALTMPGSVGVYITLSRSSGKRILYPILKQINREYKLGGIPNESDLTISFPNGSIIYLFGASDSEQIQKIRGLSNVAVIYLDEAQAFRGYIKELVEDICVKRLYDLNGRLRMIGSPGPVPAGYLYECTKSTEWSKHKWNMHSNPWLEKKSGKTVDELIAQDCKRKGCTINDPSIQRECFGVWVLDSDSLVFKYNKAKNHYDNLPELTDYVIAADIGLKDADAIAVLGWHKNSPECYLIEEHIQVGQDITSLAKQLGGLITRYKPLKVVMDTGGLGLKIAEELRKRFSLPIVAAEKSRKNTFIALTNDALRNSTLKARSDSRFAQDAMIVEWDISKSTSDRMVMKHDPHSDICDAVLYGYREALSWLSEPAPVKINLRDPKQYVEYTSKLMEEQLEKQILKQQAEENEADSYALMGMDNDQDVTRYYINKRKN